MHIVPPVKKTAIFGFMYSGWAMILDNLKNTNTLT
jgi:hypothetical protein